MLASSLLGVALLLVVAFGLVGGQEPTESPPNPLPAGAAGASSSRDGTGRRQTPGKPVDGLASLPPKARQRLQSARKLVIGKKCRAALQELELLSSEHPKVARVHYYQGAALFCLRRRTNGLKRYAEAIRLDRRYINDRRILADLARMLRRRRGRSQALQFICDHLGKAAAPMLVELTEDRRRAIRARAVGRLRELGLEARIDFVRVLGLDLEQTAPCAKREKIVEQLRELGDPRAINVLRRARDSRRRVLGILPGKRKHACIRKQIVEAIESLRESQDSATR